MNKKPASGKLPNKSTHDWSNLKLMLLEDALSKESQKEVLFVADYHIVKDLISELNERFSKSFAATVCSIDPKKSTHAENVRYTLNPAKPKDYFDLTESINQNSKIKLVVLHYNESLSTDLLSVWFLKIKKPVVTVFESLSTAIEKYIPEIRIDTIDKCNQILVHTAQDLELLTKHFGVAADRISLLPRTPSAFAHLFKNILGDEINLRYTLPVIKNNSIVRIYASELEQQQSEKFNTKVLDSDLQALIAMCMHYEINNNSNNLHALTTHLHFIEECFDAVNLYEKLPIESEITIGKAISCFGYVYSRKAILPNALSEQIETFLIKTLKHVDQLQSPCAIAYAIKGLYYYFVESNSFEISKNIERLGDKLAGLYIRHASISWSWFEQHITYTNCILAEALLFAYLSSHKAIYKKIAINAFDFLLIKAFNENSINTIANRTKLDTDGLSAVGIKTMDVVSLIQSLSTFYDVFKDETYLRQMEIAFSWFLGNNEFHCPVYNAATGSCYSSVKYLSTDDNQKSDSTADYLIARLIMEKYFKPVLDRKVIINASKTSNQNIILNKGVFLKHLVKFSVLMMMILLMIRKIFLPTKTLTPALFER
jgi:hypothetical protein